MTEQSYAFANTVIHRTKCVHRNGARRRRMVLGPLQGQTARFLRQERVIWQCNTYKKYLNLSKFVFCRGQFCCSDDNDVFCCVSFLRNQTNVIILVVSIVLALIYSVTVTFLCVRCRKQKKRTAKKEGKANDLMQSCCWK